MKIRVFHEWHMSKDVVLGEIKSFSFLTLQIAWSYDKKWWFAQFVVFGFGILIEKETG